MLASDPRIPVSKPQSDRCKCGHAMCIHSSRCQVTGCKCKRFQFPKKG